MQVLLIDPPSHHLPEGVAELLGKSGWKVNVARDYRSALDQACAGGVDALVLPAAADAGAGPRDTALTDLIRVADAGRVATLLLCEGDPDDLLQGTSLVDVVSPRTSKHDLHSRLSTLRRCQALVRRMEQELSSMERLGKRLNRHFTEVEQEMRLAGRLQRDFLPQVSEPIGPLSFSAVFRPASWVSGDIFDVFRVDERRVAFYAADAVGHGMAASLLTMFIKKAITAKRTFNDRYEVLSPSETMQGLNDALASQGLPNCQFVTACYCLVDTETLEMQFARGGHPYPLLASADGAVTELKTTGGLLGLFPGEQFATGTVQLRPGQKIILHTDGLEVVYSLNDDPESKCRHYRRLFNELARYSAREMTTRITSLLDEQVGSLNPVDDVTVIIMEVNHPPKTESA